MPNTPLHDGISVDFADVLLIINVFAIAMLLTILYIDEIIVALKRAAHAFNPHELFARFRSWRSAVRTPH